MVTYFQFSIGTWDFTLYNNIKMGKYFGISFAILFLLIMMVLFMNFLIAILSSVFSRYENQKQGLYYEVLVSKLNRYQFDDKYGSIACAILPMSILVYPMHWLTSLFSDSEFGQSIKRRINNFICHILFFPYAVLTTLLFFIVTSCIVPFAYVKQLLRTAACISSAKRNKDKLTRLQALIKFALAGPFILCTAVMVESVAFFVFLYIDSSQELAIESVSILSTSTFSIFVQTLKSFRKQSVK